MVEPVLAELARRSGRRAYFGALASGELTVAQVNPPPKSPPVGVAEGFRGASHTLALGKVLLAAMGSEYVEGYISDRGGLEAFTPRTIVQPSLLHAHLNKVRMAGVATDLEEFAENLCCVAAPVKHERGGVEGAIGLSTTRSIRGKLRQLAELSRWAAEEASKLLSPVLRPSRAEPTLPAPPLLPWAGSAPVSPPFLPVVPTPVCASVPVVDAMLAADAFGRQRRAVLEGEARLPAVAE